MPEVPQHNRFTIPDKEKEGEKKGIMTESLRTFAITILLILLGVVTWIMFKKEEDQ